MGNDNICRAIQRLSISVVTCVLLPAVFSNIWCSSDNDCCTFADASWPIQEHLCDQIIPEAERKFIDEGAVSPVCQSASHA